MHLTFINKKTCLNIWHVGNIGTHNSLFGGETNSVQLELLLVALPVIKVSKTSLQTNGELLVLLASEGSRAIMHKKQMYPS